MVETISREVDLGWLAGIIEGEGSVGFYLIAAHKNRRDRFGNPLKQIRTQIQIPNSDVRIIKRVSEILFDLGIRFYYNLNRREKKNILKLIICGKGNCKKLGKSVLPYLHGSKLDQIRTLIDAIEYRENLGHRDKDGNGFRSSKWIAANWQGDPRLMAYIDAISLQKDDLIDPSTTKRRASQILTW